MNCDFYLRLPVLDSFDEIVDFRHYHELPDDWHVVVADIKGSTAAIREGRYKAVNVVGVSIISAVLNAIKPLRVPYVFGGDGASLCVPASVVQVVSAALIATKRMARVEFGLHLRAGIIPMSAILDKGFNVLVTCHRISPHCTQAAFRGGGLEFAESSIKNDQEPSRWLVPDDVPAGEADYTGLECRWDAIPSARGEIISLIVKAMATDDRKTEAVYRRVLDRIRTIYGDSVHCRPVTEDLLRLAMQASSLRYESSIRTTGRRILHRLRYAVRLRWDVLAGCILMRCGIRTGDTDWGTYRAALAANTDFRKFDGTLRLVLSGTRECRRKLRDYLDGEREGQHLIYGIHTSTSALITCLIHERSGEHYHFVDGADGGYALAAMEMKSMAVTG